MRARRTLGRPQSLLRKRRCLSLSLLLDPDALQDLVGDCHRHAAEVGDKVYAVSMASLTTF